MQMTRTLAFLAIVSVFAAACDRSPERDATRGASQARPDAPPAQPQTSNIPTTPANIGQPRTMDEKKEGANPQQGQVDPKERAQHRDFKHSGDGNGPTSPETKPRS